MKEGTKEGKSTHVNVDGTMLMDTNPVQTTQVVVRTPNYSLALERGKIKHCRYGRKPRQYPTPTQDLKVALSR